MQNNTKISAPPPPSLATWEEISCHLPNVMGLYTHCLQVVEKGTKVFYYLQTVLAPTSKLARQSTWLIPRLIRWHISSETATLAQPEDIHSILEIRYPV